MQIESGISSANNGGPTESGENASHNAAGRAPGAHDGQAPDRYQILFADERLEYRSATIDDPIVTGRQLITASGNEPVDEFVILQVLPTGDLEELRLNESTDLRRPGSERFIVVKSDRTFRLVIGDERQEWPAPLINGRTLKRIGQKEVQDYSVFLERQDEADQEIDDDQFIDLAAAGVEHFYFRPIERIVEIFVNEKSVRITRGEHIGLEIKEAAIAQGVRIELDFVLSLHKAGGQTQIIGDQDPVNVHRGQRYTAVADDDKS